jgi:hypothetical protein
MVLCLQIITLRINENGAHVTNITFGPDLGTSIFLLHKSTKAQVSRAEIEAVWDKLTDTRGARGEVVKANRAEPAKLRAMLRLLGVVITTEEAKKQSAKPWLAKTVAHKNTVIMEDDALLARYRLDAKDEEAAPGDALREDFVSVEMKAHGGSASMGLFIFFVQTLALILQESALFGSLSIVNFDTDAGAPRDAHSEAR